jgi:hypothetical protein
MIYVGALCFIIPSFIWAFFLLVFRLRSKTAIGTIIGEDAMPGVDGGSDLSAPIVEFQLPDGRKITFTEKVHSNETILDFLYKLFSQYVLKRDMTKVLVLYNPNDPQKARVNSFSNLYFMPVLLFFIGFCMVLYGIPFSHSFLDPIFKLIDRFTNNL